MRGRERQDPRRWVHDPLLDDRSVQVLADHAHLRRRLPLRGVADLAMVGVLERALLPPRVEAHEGRAGPVGLVHGNGGALRLEREPGHAHVELIANAQTEGLRPRPLPMVGHERSHGPRGRELLEPRLSRRLDRAEGQPHHRPEEQTRVPRPMGRVGRLDLQPGSRRAGVPAGGHGEGAGGGFIGPGHRGEEADDEPDCDGDLQGMGLGNIIRVWLRSCAWRSGPFASLFPVEGCPSGAALALTLG